VFNSLAWPTDDRIQGGRLVTVVKGVDMHRGLIENNSASSSTLLVSCVLALILDATVERGDAPDERSST